MDDDFEWLDPLPAPDFTMMPDLAFDVIMRHCSGTEWKILTFLMRQTYGWRREWAEVTLPDICGTCGISRRAAIDAIKELERVRLVEVRRRISENGKEANTYLVRVTADRRYISRTSDMQDSPPRTERKAHVPSTSKTERRGQRASTPDYTQGRYAVCPECGIRPCADDCQAQTYPRLGRDA